MTENGNPPADSHHSARAVSRHLNARTGKITNSIGITAWRCARHAKPSARRGDDLHQHYGTEIYDALDVICSDA